MNRYRANFPLDDPATFAREVVDQVHMGTATSAQGRKPMRYQAWTDCVTTKILPIRRGQLKLLRTAYLLAFNNTRMTKP